MSVSSLPQLSFEFFPPASAEQAAALWQQIEQLAPLNPRFVSVTYGAGGSTRERTHQLVHRLRHETTLEPAAHLTCIGSTREEIATIARSYWDGGIRHIVALRGDKPADQPHYQPQPEGYDYADALVAGLKEVADFEISVAAYPETHPEATSPQADMDHLKRKLDAGATRAITQYFFDADLYFRFLDRLEKAGVNAEVVPGILPIANYAQLVRFSAMCGATVPDAIHTRLSHLTDSAHVQRIGTELATSLCETLLQSGIPHLHFYTLNRSAMVLEIGKRLGITR